MKVVLLDGSPAAPSRVNVLLNTVASRLHDKGYETQILELHALGLPINDPAYHANPQDHPSAVVRDFAATVQGANIIILGTPLYHGSYSGLLKMALDHLTDDAFAGKTVGIASNASGPRSSFQAALELVPVARSLEGNVHTRLVGTCKSDYGMKDDIFQIIEPAILDRINLFADELAAKNLYTASSP